MVAKNKSSDLEKETKAALKDIGKMINNIASVVKRDFGKIKVKYKEGKIVKKARGDLSKGLTDLAKSLRKSARKVKGKK